MGDVDIEQSSVAASAGYRLSPRMSVRLTAGAILGGTLDVGDRSFDVRPGWLLTASVSRRWDVGRWFVAGTFSAGASFASTEEVGVADAATIDLMATDARFGVLWSKCYDLSAIDILNPGAHPHGAPGFFYPHIAGWSPLTRFSMTAGR